MADLNLKRFKDKVEQYYSSVSPDGRRRATQKQLAEAIHLDTYELNRRLNGTDGARLTPNDVQLIVKTLAEWRAISTRSQATELLQLMSCSDFEAIDWGAEPLKSLASPPPAGLVLDDLDIDTPYWENVHYFRFTLSNPTSGILFVDRIQLKILKATPCELLFTPNPGAQLKPFEFEIDLNPDQSTYLVTDDFFAYKKGDIDAFKIKMTSSYYYVYEVRVDVEWHNVSDGIPQVVNSRVHTIAFRIEDTDKAISTIKSHKNSDA